MSYICINESECENIIDKYSIKQIDKCGIKLLGFNEIKEGNTYYTVYFNDLDIPELNKIEVISKINHRADITYHVKVNSEYRDCIMNDRSSSSLEILFQHQKHAEYLLRTYLEHIKEQTPLHPGPLWTWVYNSENDIVVKTICKIMDRYTRHKE